jgi:O-antigen/teichoic acid export membrane protein
MSRTERFVLGAGLGYVHLVVVTLVGLWLTPFLLEQLGSHDYGLWLVGLQIVAYLQLIDLGVVALLPREVAYATGRGLRGETDTGLGALVRRTERLARWQALGLAGIAVVVWVALPAEWAGLRWPLAAVLLGLVLIFPFRVLQALLQGLQDLAFLGRLQLAAWAAGTVVMVGLVLAGARLHALVAGWLTTQIVTVAACAVRVRVRFPTLRADHGGGVSLTTREYLGRSVWVSVSQVAQTLLGATDVLVIGAVAGPAAVVPYACTAKLVQVLANHPQLLMQAAAPALSEMRIAESRGRLLATSSALTRAVLIISGGVVSVVVAINQPFVSWWVGPSQYGGAALTAALAAALLLRHLNTTTVYALFCFGHERRLSLTALADGSVMLTGSLVLVPVVGPIGVALASIAGVVAVSLPSNMSAFGRETGIGPLEFLRTLSGWATRFLVALTGAVAFAWLPVGPRFWHVAAAAAAVAAWYAVVMWPAAMDGPLGGYLRAVGATLRSRVQRHKPVPAAPVNHV